MIEENSLKDLFNSHASALTLYVRQWCNDRAEAEDVVQDAFVQYWLHRKQARDATGYLYAAVRSRAMDRHRGNERRSRRESDAARPDAQSWFSNEPEQKEFAQIVQTNLKQLPPEQAEVVILKLWAELTFAQISQLLAIPPDTAASRYRYAIDALRKLMKHEVMP